jgi:hypothetical protein
MSKYYNATIQWLDTYEINDDMIFKIGDIEDDDDDVFFYLDSEKEIEEFQKQGSHEWRILSINQINNKLWD